MQIWQKFLLWANCFCSTASIDLLAKHSAFFKSIKDSFEKKHWKEQWKKNYSSLFSILLSWFASQAKAPNCLKYHTMLHMPMHLYTPLCFCGLTALVQCSSTMYLALFWMKKALRKLLGPISTFQPFSPSSCQMK